MPSKHPKPSTSQPSNEDERRDRLYCHAKKYQSKEFPKFDKPIAISECTLDRTRAIQLGRGNVRYFYDKYLQPGSNLSLDIVEGIETFDNKEVFEKLDILLKWIMKLGPQGGNMRKVIHEAGFVCWRGALTRIASMPFENENRNYEGNKIACMLFNGVVFVCEFDTELKKANREKENDFAKKATYCGFKFEQCATTDEIDKPPNTNEPVSNWNEFSVLFKTTMGENEKRITVLYGAEVDAITKDGRHYVELKTHFGQIGKSRGWDLKSMRWWIQSYLVNISHLFVGLRTDNFIVKEIKAVDVKGLPDRQNSNPKIWSPVVCLNFLNAFLCDVRDCLQSAPEGTILIAERTPNQTYITYTEIPVGHKEYGHYNLITEEFKLYFRPNRGVKRAFDSSPASLDTQAYPVL